MGRCRGSCTNADSASDHQCGCHPHHHLRCVPASPQTDSRSYESGVVRHRFYRDPAHGERRRASNTPSVVADPPSACPDSSPRTQVVGVITARRPLTNDGVRRCCAWRRDLVWSDLDGDLRTRASTNSQQPTTTARSILLTSPI
jgi:hypothetical protein